MRKMANKMKTISDTYLMKIPVRDNGEKLVNLKTFCPGIKINIDPKSQKVQKLPIGSCYARVGVVKRLNKAQKLLTKDHKLMIWSAHREIKIQKKLYKDQYEIIRKANPAWTESKLKKEADRYVAPIEIIPPHTTGGAVDLTIVDTKNKQLDMGTKLDSFCRESNLYAKNISKKAKENRKILVAVMTKAGFVNYPPEWWHWSYGDRYWAAVKNKKFSIYKSL